MSNKDIIKSGLINKGWINLGNSNIVHKGGFDIVVGHSGDCALYYNGIFIDSTSHKTLDVDEILEKFKLSTIALIEELKCLEKASI